MAEFLKNGIIGKLEKKQVEVSCKLKSRHVLLGPGGEHLVTDNWKSVKAAREVLSDLGWVEVK